MFCLHVCLFWTYTNGTIKCLGGFSIGLFAWHNVFKKVHHAVGCIGSSFPLWPNNSPLLFIHILIALDIWVFTLLVLINNAMYMYVQGFAWSYTFIFLGLYPGSEIAGSNGLTLGELPDCFQNGYYFLFIPTSSIQGFLFLLIFTNACYYLAVLLKPSLWVWSDTLWFWITSLWLVMTEHLLMCIWPPVCLFWRSVYSDPLLFLSWVNCFYNHFKTVLNNNKFFERCA